MLSGVKSVLRIKQDKSSAESVFGVMPKDVPWAMIEELKGDKAGVRKWRDGMLVVLPVVKSKSDDILVWQVWILGDVPEISVLPQRIEEIRKASAGFEQAWMKKSGGSKAAQASSSAIDTVLERVATVYKAKKSALLKVIADEIVKAGLAKQAVVAFSKSAAKTRIPRRHIAASNEELEVIKDELRRFIPQLRGEEHQARTIDFSQTSDEDWESGVLLEMVESKKAQFDILPDNTPGLSFLLFDPVENAEQKLEQTFSSLRNYYKSTRPMLHSKKATLWQKTRMPLVGCIVLGFIIFSLLPAPFRVSATVFTEPKEAIISSLETNAVLEQVFVSPGDDIKKGDLIASLRSADLESQLADAKLQLSVEDLEGKAALADNQYGSFVISEQRKEIEVARIAMLERRIEALQVKATEDGSIISAIPAGRAGSFINQGVEIAKLQPTNGFRAAMDFNKIDAPLIKAGQIGTAFFRGASTENFDLVVEHPVALTPTEDGTDFRLISRAVILDTSNTDLIVGLSGFAKVDVGQKPRIMIWSRFVREFVREKLWIYLNLKI